jgi:hypothetical protein
VSKGSVKGDLQSITPCESIQSACSARVLHLPHHIRVVFSDAIFAGAHSRTHSFARSLSHSPVPRPARSEFSFELAAASGGFKKVTERRAHKIFSALVNRAGGGGGVVSNKRNGSTTLLFIRGARASAASSGCMQERPRPGSARTPPCAHTPM